MPADDWEIPDLESLLRNVLRKAMTAEVGVTWLSSVPPDVAKKVADAASLARRKRPDEVLRDDWDAAGMPTIRALIAWRLPEALTPVWPDANHAEVDLGRLIRARDKKAHQVGPPLPEVHEAESLAIVTRLRLSLEDVRRRLDEEESEWWPYIASVHSNIASLCWERSAGWSSGPTTLNEGDLVTLQVLGVNPNGPQDLLRYDYRMIQNGGVQQSIAWDAAPTASFEVPRCRTVLFRVSVGDAHDISNVDYIKRELRVRPRR